MALDLSALRRIIADENRLLTGADIPAEYQSDVLGRIHGSAEALAFPLSTEEVSALLRYAHEHRVPVTPRGAGTNLVGSTVPLEGGIILDLSRMDRVLELDEDTMTVTVEPGMLLQDLQAYVEARGLFYPPDPGEKASSIGGNISTNAGGMRAVKYGVTRDYVRGLEVVLADGTVMQVGGKQVKDASGLSLKHLLIGSEGTLAVITKCLLRLVPKPEASLSVLVPYADLKTGIQSVLTILRANANPTAVEFMERKVVALGERFCGVSYLAFGDDEETINLGALAIAEHLKAQGVTLEFVLDEGGCKIEPGTAFGAPETSIVSVQLMEKGYADLELSVHSIGGHSSRPYGGTSLGRLSGAIADITRAPFAVRLNSAMTGAFETLAPYITQEPLKTLVQDVAGNADAIAACCMGSPDLFPFVATTIAPTMIRGGSAACNVMPQDMTAVINFRIADGDSTESVMAHCREAVQDKGVEMRFLQANDPSAIARRDGYGYRTVVESFQRYYPEAVFIPSMAVGATDAHRYEEICDTCLRCSPFMTEPMEAASGVHGTNERLLVRSYLQGIRVLIDLMEHANVEP